MIVENPTEFESFLEKYKQSDCIVIPILSDINKHPLENSLCARSLLFGQTTGLYYSAKVFRRRNIKPQVRPAGRMTKPEYTCVESRAAQGFPRCPPRASRTPIPRVSGNRHTHGCKMYSNLMSSPRFWLNFEQRTSCL